MLLTTFLAGISVAAAIPSKPLYARQNATTTLDGYEYVVVGSGPGGGPLAARLAMAGHKTLLIDAGDDQGENIHYQVPAFQGKEEYTHLFWQPIRFTMPADMYTSQVWSPKTLSSRGTTT